MKKICFVFDGQGSFYPGMGKQIYNDYEIVRNLFKEADALLGESTADYCFGKKAVLTRRDNMWMQIAISIINLSYAFILEENNLQPSYCLGHSLGEVSAVIFSGAVNFNSGIKLIKKRGELMAKAAGKAGGGMLAVQNTAIENLEELLQTINKKNDISPSIANINSPSQIIISGLNEELQILSREFHQKKIRSKKLDIAGPWHSIHLNCILEEFKDFLDTIDFVKPVKRFYSVTELCELTDPGQIRSSLVKQLVTSVNWRKAVDNLIALGYNSFIEVGPGKILKNLIRQISIDVNCESIITYKNIADITGAF